MASQRNVLMLALTALQIPDCETCQHKKMISVAKGVSFYATERQAKQLEKAGDAERFEAGDKSTQASDASDVKAKEAESADVITPENSKLLVPENTQALSGPEETKEEVASEEEKPKARKRVKAKPSEDKESE